MPTKCGLLGQKLSHSYSPAIHSYLGSYNYELYEKEPEELEVFLKSGDFTGINVTIPYKKAVIPYLDSLTTTAQTLGAVNTIVRKDGKLIGHNTDWFGFTAMVKRSGLDICGKKVLVLGSGGAASTVIAVLKEMDAMPVVVSRSGEDNYGNLYRHKDAAMIVNTTPVGMYPQTGSAPVDLAQFSMLEGVLDLIYNPARTKLLMDASERGLITENGLLMLVAQAKESAEWFSGQAIADDRIMEIYRKLRAQTENIVLIGMPGCGKSTVAARLSAELGRPLVDADHEIRKAAGCDIMEIFANSGEDAFRLIETGILEKLGKESGLVIATGGGCVTRAENYPLLHQNGKIFWLQRDIKKLPKEGRPLSLTGNLEAMLEVRAPLYRKFADYTVNNDGTPEATVNTIVRILGESE